MTNEEIEDISKFNITKFILHCFENNIPIQDSFFENLNLKEISIVKVEYFDETGRYIHYYITESLMENMIKHVPLEVYKKHINYKWIEEVFLTEKDDSKLIDKILQYEKIDLLEYLHEICFEKAQKDKNFVNTYISSYLQPILNLKENIRKLNYNDENNESKINLIERYRILIDTCFKEKKHFIEELYNSNGKRKSKKTQPSFWIEELEHNYNYKYDFDYNFNDFLSLLLQKEFNTPLLIDSLEQFKTKYSKKLDFILGLDKKNDNMENILKVAIKNKNLKGIDLILKKFNINPLEVLEAFNQNIEENWSYVKNNNIEDFQKMIIENCNDFYFTLKDKYFKDKDSYYLQLFIFNPEIESKKTNNIINNIINSLDNDNNLTIDIEKRHSFKDALIFSLIIEKYMEEFKLSIENQKFSHSINDISKLLLINEPLFKKITQKIKLSSLKDKEWNVAKNLFITTFGEKDSKKWIDNFHLNHSLNTKNITKNKLKI